MHFISASDLGHDDIGDLLDSAASLKESRIRGKVTNQLENKSLAMLFEKASTRTRISFEVGMADLGGNATYLNWSDLQLGRGESIADTAKVISTYAHGIMIRAYKHSTVQELASNSSIPVINGLSDLEHPCQTLADLMTIREHKRRFPGLKVAWIGDGNNVCNSLILAAAVTGMQISAACPEGYEPDERIISKAKDLGGELEIAHDPVKSTSDADVLYTDVWVSMGDESQREERLKAFQGFQINKELLSHAKQNVIVMHCLPAHRGEEITGEVMDGPNSVIFEQAENRLHAQKALLLRLLG